MALKIMAVDDDPQVLNLLRIMVEPLGCEVVMIEDSREAARLIEREKFDGVFLDALMPHMDGFQLAQHIRTSRLNHEVPIVMLTGYKDADTMRKGFNAGVSLFLGKPFTRERIAVLFGAARSAMLKEKRKYARLPLRTTITCRWAGHRQGQFKAGSVDICEDGMMFGPSGGLDVDQEVELEFEVPAANTPVKTRAKVIRREKSDNVAVEFVALPLKDRDSIKAYIGARVKG